jgi:dihydropyrimidinase
MAGEGKSLLIRGGLLVTDERQWQADVRVRDGKIVEIGNNLQAGTPPERIIDAHGLQVLPGGIDPHAHLTPPWVDDYESGSRAALAGGITTIGCMVYGDVGESLVTVLQTQTKRAQEQAMADIFLHPYVWTALDQIPKELPRLPENGHTSIKIFMVSQEFARQEAQYIEIIGAAGRLGIVTLLHCEDAETLAQTAQELAERRHTSLYHYAKSRPVSSEVRAVERAIAICDQTKAPVYLVHISSREALILCRKAKKRGLPVYVETRPLYLYFTKERYHESDGPLYVGQPPLRDSDDVADLWQGISDGTIDTLGSDHAPWTREQKMESGLDIHNLRPGVADLQTMLPVFYSEAVVKRKMSLSRFVAITATNAAKIFGLFPRKGTLAVGSDADLALWNPREKYTLCREELMSRAGFSLHEGWEIFGRLYMTIRRGEVVAENGEIVALPGSGIVPRRRR